MKSQRQLQQYEKEVTYDLFLMSIEWLEKYIEVAHKKDFPNWKKQKQIHDNNIIRTDVNNDPEMAKDTLSTQLLLLESNLRRRPEFIREEIKVEYYKWISSVGIDEKNCPEKLKGLLFGINEILEGRGEKIRREVEEEKPIASAEEMRDLFVYSHSVVAKEEKREKNLSGKNYKDIEIGGKFEGSSEQGEKSFKQIAKNVNYRDFHFFPSQEHNQQRNNIKNMNNLPILIPFFVLLTSVFLSIIFIILNKKNKRLVIV